MVVEFLLLFFCCSFIGMVEVVVVLVGAVVVLLGVNVERRVFTPYPIKRITEHSQIYYLV